MGRLHCTGTCELWCDLIGWSRSSALVISNCPAVDAGLGPLSSAADDRDIVAGEEVHREDRENMHINTVRKVERMNNEWHDSTWEHWIIRRRI
jgi:hypothetical protein